ncbi:flavodoxin family protein [Undibacterium sp. TJN19]|uniref:flavodoxin family protein n=1 Tax=Undibacterium sp. TJN19 TaxID=3413055 RepID=UPI003BF440E7
MTQLSTIILLGTSRSTGNTCQLAHAISEKIQARVIDLNDYEIASYDYEFKNQGDDFLALITEVMRYDRIILASPMYWYAPSAQMKIFMDRLSDLLKIQKDLGRQLRKKKAALLGTGCDAVPPACYEQVFKLTFDYLGMDYQGMLYASCEDDFVPAQHATAIQTFSEHLYAQ